MNLSAEQNEMINSAFSYFGLTNSATREDVHKAYLNLVKRYHPDKFQDMAAKELAEEKIKEANNVNEGLNLYFNLREEENKPKQSSSTNSNNSTKSAQSNFEEKTESQQILDLIEKAMAYFALPGNCTKDDVYMAYLDLVNFYQDEIAHSNLYTQAYKMAAAKELEEAKKLKDLLYGCLLEFEEKNKSKYSSFASSNSSFPSYKELRKKKDAAELENLINDCFSTFGLSKSASKTELLKAFLKSKMKYSPERYKDPADKEFAYQNLKKMQIVKTLLDEYIIYCEEENKPNQSSSTNSNNSTNNNNSSSKQQHSSQSSAKKDPKKSNQSASANQKSSSNYYYSYYQEEKENRNNAQYNSENYKEEPKSYSQIFSNNHNSNTNYNSSDSQKTTQDSKKQRPINDFCNKYFWHYIFALFLFGFIAPPIGALLFIGIIVMSVLSDKEK